jgi:hypothetical protein
MSYFPIAKHFYKFAQCLLFFANLLSCASFFYIVVETQIIINMNRFHTLLADTEGRKSSIKERKAAVSAAKDIEWIGANSNGSQKFSLLLHILVFSSNLHFLFSLL